MAGIFNASIFNEAIFNTGIGVVEDEPGIGLATAPQPIRAPVDFVYADGWHSSMRASRKVAFIDTLRAAKREKSEFREMIGLYSNWKKAA